MHIRVLAHVSELLASANNDHVCANYAHASKKLTLAGTSRAWLKLHLICTSCSTENIVIYLCTYLK